MGDVVRMRGMTKLDIPPDNVLEAALGQLSTVTIIGIANDGSEYFASSVKEASHVVFMAERCKHRMMRIVDEVE